MKAFLIFLLPALLITSCANKTPKAVVKIEPRSLGIPLNEGETHRVRHAETIKAYPMGRYVDPHNRKVMHEAHTIYRVEATSKWNLAKSGSSPPPLVHPAPTADLNRNELLVELNRQREATKSVMQSGQTVSSKLTELTAALHQNRVLAQQNASIQKELAATRNRLETLEQRLLKQPSSTPETTPTVEDAPW